MALTVLDVAVFLIAGIIGAVGAWRGGTDARWGWGGSLAWAIVAVWALLKLLKVIA